MQGFGTFNYGHDHKNSEIKLGAESGYYKYSFFAESAWKRKTINLVFDGAMTDTEVKVNGNLVGPIHQGDSIDFLMIFPNS